MKLTGRIQYSEAVGNKFLSAVLLEKAHCETLQKQLVPYLYRVFEELIVDTSFLSGQKYLNTKSVKYHYHTLKSKHKADETRNSSIYWADDEEVRGKTQL